MTFRATVLETGLRSAAVFCNRRIQIQILCIAKSQLETKVNSKIVLEKEIEKRIEKHII